tara:strand:- start:1045 stop:2358 length:1314 start_codon:yes stop_codon:yes gene_type:complete
MKPSILVTAPIKTRSGYGNHSRDICRALIESDKYDVHINSVRWGATPMTALEEGNPVHDEISKRILLNPQLPAQPDVHLHIVIPNEFQPIAKKNIGVTAGIETTIPNPQWVEGCNKMDETIFVSDFTRNVFLNASFQDKNGKEVKMKRDSSILFEGVDTDTYKQTTKISDDVNALFNDVEEDFGFLFVGHWLSGNLGQDRKDTGMLIKVFCETFKNQKKPPALILKTSGADFSILDREDILKKVRTITDSIQGELPNVYVIHGDFTDSEMNDLYNHPKVKAHISFTHGEGYGRPLLEAAQSGKPVIAPGWSGQLDFLNPNYSVLLNGSLTQVPKDAFQKGVFFDSPENKWFTVNYNIASSIMKDVVKNYSKYLLKGKQLAAITSKTFSHDAMREKLVEIIDKQLESVPRQVDLKLPKLNKVEDSKPSEIKLPKLKKV